MKPKISINLSITSYSRRLARFYILVHLAAENLILETRVLSYFIQLTTLS